MNRKTSNTKNTILKYTVSRKAGNQNSMFIPKSLFIYLFVYF